MFIGAKVVHSFFGEGTIIDLEMNTIDEIKSKIVVKFEDGIERRFHLYSINKFFTEVPSNIIEYIESI